MVREETDRLHDAIFAEMTFHAAYEPFRAVRTERWKYIRRFDDYRHPVLPNCDDSASKDLLVEHGWAEQLIAEEQLYDLVFDPTEARNLAGDPAHVEVLTVLRSRLDEWMAETDDPLLQGPVDSPPGAQINDRSQRSASDAPRVSGSPAIDGLRNRS